ncbi:MAG: hypothetical protein IJX27_06865 [Clostridia bacterium]|nr:hypothetical protein [Clostridia bacterium]
MKNEQAAKSLYGAGTEAEAEAVIAKNLEYVFRAEAYAHERKFAHLKERAERIARALKAQTGSADIMDAVSDSYEAADIFASMRGEKQDFSKFFGKPNTEAAYPLSENSSKLDEFYICKCISAYDGGKYSKKDIVRWLSEAEEPAEIYAPDRKVSFVRGNGSGRAFERFAKYVPGVLAEYEEDFRRSLEAVANGESTFAIVPIENSLDGRLNSFYRLMEKYVLSILLAADIPSDDYESSTKFALVYKKLDVIEAQGESLFECKITLREPAELAEIIDAASYFGAEVCKVHSLPLSSGGRENSFDIIFGIDKADIAGLFAYLMLKYPHLSPIGIYTLMEDW